MESKFIELLNLINSYSKDERDLETIERAWKFSKIVHTGQKRLSGEPYVAHELQTAYILALWKMDVKTVVAGLLHDSVEDGAASMEDIEKDFGSEVAGLIDGVTKVSYLKLRGSKEEEFVENLRKMFLAMAKDLRVVLVKLADRLHNMQTLQYLPEEKKVRIARETLEVYAPLAERLGMGKVKVQLDELAFPYVYPEEYEKVKHLSLIHYKKTEEHIKKIRTTILKSLAREKIKAHVEGRKKHLYSLWKKLERSEIDWDFSQVNDIVALRILVETTPQCYTALGVVHRHYKPVPHLGISDFIAQPKPNGYRSIHTKVFGPAGRIVEVQIRTFEMHKEAEYGLAAHWHLSVLKAKKGISSQDVEEGKRNIVDQSKFHWVRQLADWQKEIKDSKEFLESVKFDALRERIFVFSPNGDVFDLPVGSTPIDFAYAVHTDLGEFVKGVRVDGKIVPLNFKLGSGQVVEIIKSKNPKTPNADWLEFVVTTLARRELNKYLRKVDSKND